MIDEDSSILLVDDSMVTRQTVKTILVIYGYTNIDVASNG
jgi:CheY-like chemotaxis protein